ncbi:hypothetical protein HME9302_02590 [Alteripontixanthobacter maritimus]|uniref:SGNH domain-containing protein n=1 Tax=Alteripontixanthobacter maritimus TaxID=2161824 RepID=A0A369QGE7_9SPHN|nr:hypothetical protein [Alteripontixanthobacter maritimus]RDC61368.1 hypothetical protein HME9302_02590 [Alteripontixanthobacter maritimus]
MNATPSERDKTVLIIIFCVIASVAATAPFFATKRYYYGELSYAKTRAGFVVQEAQQVGKVDTLVIGDSLIEQTYFPDRCGSVFAAGIGGARVRDFQAIIDELLSATQPDTVIVALGAKHFSAGDELQEFAQSTPHCSIVWKAATL